MFQIARAFRSCYAAGAGCLVLASAAAAGCHPPRAEAARASIAVGTGPAPFATPPVLVGTPDIATLAARVRGAVVSISTRQRMLSAADPEAGAPPFPSGPGPGGRGRGAPGSGGEGPTRRGLGSGFVVDARGYVVTNAHVVEGADSLRVKLADDREFEAKVRGRDRRLDIAVLELVGARDLPAAVLGDSSVLRVGEYVVAIGNPFGLGNTVTMGILSAKGRAIGAGPYDDFLQTDASINPGNSGGPLFNLRGQVIGINTAINPNGRGIGFAIPSELLQGVLQQLIDKGQVLRGRLGVYHQSVDAPLARAFGLEKPAGALVREVEPQGPADKAGIKSGDLILAVGESAIVANHDLPLLVARIAPGTKVKLKLLRDKQAREIEVVVDELKDEEPTVSASGAPNAPATTGGFEIVDARGGGAQVVRVVPGSRFAETLRDGDILVEINRESVSDAQAARTMLGRQSGALLLKVRRGAMIMYLALE